MTASTGYIFRKMEGEIMNRKLKFIALMALVVYVAIFMAGCASYKQQAMPVKMPSAYQNNQRLGDAEIAAKDYNDAEEASATFGFDIRGAGVLPVQVVFDNKGSQVYEIVAGQTFLVDEKGNMWPILESSVAYDRISKKTELGKIAPEATKKGVLSGIAGAMIGAAIGIVTGTNVGDAALKGAAVGAAAGATAGGIQGYADTRDVDRKISEDLQKRTLENKEIVANGISYGFLFFPGESGKPTALRLKLKEKATGTIQALNFSL